jgi:hypothetical protein
MDHPRVLKVRNEESQNVGAAARSITA